MSTPTGTWTGANEVAATLVAGGVDTVYALPGEETIDLLEAVHDAGIEIVVTRHEQHAAFMAATHGRLSGAPGVVVTTLGPGAINALTGLAQASLDGFPMLLLCGQKPERDNPEGSFQVVDLVAMARPVCAFARRSTDVAELGADLAAALVTTVVGRPGPAVLVIPEDLAAAEVERARTSVAYPAPSRVDPQALGEAARRLGDAERPVLLVGGGAQRDGGALARCAERWELAVVPVQMGAGALPADHRCALPTLGIHQADASSVPLLRSDLVLTIGYHPTEHPPLAWNPDDDCPVIHLAPWVAPVQRGYRPELQLVGDLAPALDGLAERAPAGRDVHARRTSALRDAVRSAVAIPGSTPEPQGAVNSVQLLRALRAHLERDDIVALDNGIYKVWFAREYPALAPQTMLLDNGLATMGAGLAIAMTAARLRPGRRVVAVVGDGGFMMNVADLETAVRLEPGNLTVVVVRDDAYGFIAQHQHYEGMPRRAVDLRNPDFVALAEAFGVTALRADRSDELDAVLSTALGTVGLTLVDCPVDASINTLLDNTDDRRAAAEAALT